jgi:hypothetical protein
MNLLAFWLNAAIFGVSLLVLYKFFLSIIRKRACFRMYAVRDDLVYLVASGVLDEDNKVFQHYYRRTNDLLCAAPDIGIDNILRVVFTMKRDGEDFDGILMKAEEQTKVLFEDKAFLNEEVRRVVSQYYRGVQSMILSHSSILRAIYHILRHLAGHFGQHLAPLTIPGEYGRALRAVEYAGHEADSLQAVRS